MRGGALGRTEVQERTVDLVVIGSGTGLAAALTGTERGLSTLVIEKTEYVGGSTALSGGAFWIPANSVLADNGVFDSEERGNAYLDAVVGDTAPQERRRAYVRHGPETVDMLRRLTPLKFIWAQGYSDYHPENPGGAASGRSCESAPFDVKRHLGAHRALLRPTKLAAPVPMPITSPDYRWINLMAKVPSKGVTRAAARVGQGIGGKLIGREYVAGGQALAAGLFAGAIAADVPIWTRTSLVRLLVEDGRVGGVVVVHDGREVTVTARRGVVLSAGGFDRNMAWRHEYQSPSLQEWSQGAPGNTGDAIAAAMDVGGDIDLMDQAWWFPSVAPLPGADPAVMLAERSLPGSMIVDRHGRRFINESIDYMTFGQELLRRERAGDPVGDMWIVFDQTYKNSYVFATISYPRMPLPRSWYEHGIAARADTPGQLAERVGLPQDEFVQTVERFNQDASTGFDSQFHRGDSVYDRYYGDPTNLPNPNLRPLTRGPFYAVKVIPSDLGTCGGLRADGTARVLRADGSVIPGLYATGNTAANAFGSVYPGAGATIGQGLVFGHIAAGHAASQE
ncbi:3-ketosteroid-delta-1-dehydrogenase [Actinomadura violacea]|uniref:3-ketosteroid-delta-1-dehydrogenase n=1 Tax=Actinomadura violacea TaxID=2819934 RepID=A0ABS3RMW6_9ACTN|nr:3-ketosteroid-delta-1-dehydrogenase [Actinomadura violacea]MBO2458051.1 3-ketosteroid-delta-1-dehydrogenase [Actinomadura violacea]